MTANTLIGLLLSAVGAAIVWRLCPAQRKPRPVTRELPQFVGGPRDGEYHLRGNGEWIGTIEPSSPDCEARSGTLAYYRWNDRTNRWVFQFYLPADVSEREVRRLCFSAVECSGTGNRSGK